jgi:membrane protein DedA with SNARE-associated domain
LDAFVGHLLAGTHGALAYATVYGILVLCGLGLPLPEDVSLILGGYLSYAGAVHLAPMVVIGFLGILTGDSIIFFAGRRLGRNLRPEGWIARLVTPTKLRRVEHLFARWGQKIVMAARFLPGIRAVVYFAAGTSGLAYPLFILFDGLAACVSAPLFVLCGRHFGGQIYHFILVARQTQGMVFGLALAGALFYVLVQRRQLRLDQAEEKAFALQPRPEGLDVSRSQGSLPPV